jgi:hypothetical protein
MKPVTLVLGLLLSGIAVAAAGQSLADIARAEAARRKTVVKSGKVYTNDSLERDFAVPRPPAEPARSAPTAPAIAQPTPAASEAPAVGETYWRSRIASARSALQRSQVLAAALQSHINALTTDFVNRDDPVQRAGIAEDREKALSELERVRLEISERAKSVAAVEEEARKAGVPPGWLR